MSRVPPVGRAGSNPLVTISVVSHGDGLEIADLLASLREHEQISQIQMIVTDNLGGDLPEYDPAKWDDLIVRRNPSPRGLASNHNAAFPLTRGRYFCMLNPDVVFVERIFESLIRQAGADGGRIVAPLVVDSQGIPQDSFRDLPKPWELVRRRLASSTAAAELPPAASGPIVPDWIAGVFLLMKRELFDQLGGLDERYRLYFEDVDFCTRARLNGISLLVDRTVSIRHDANRSSRKDLRFLLWHLQSAFRFYTSGVYRQARDASRGS